MGTPATKKTARERDNFTLDYRSDKPLPDWVREVIDTPWRSESRMPRAPARWGSWHARSSSRRCPTRIRRPTHSSAPMRLRAAHRGGLRGRHSLRHLSTSPDVMGDHRGSANWLSGHRAGRLAAGVPARRARAAQHGGRGSLLTAQYTGGLDKRGFTLCNVLIADDLHLSEDDATRFAGVEGTAKEASDDSLWMPQPVHEANQWRSQVRLSSNFRRERVDNSVPIDLSAYKALRGNPLGMDVYIFQALRLARRRLLFADGARLRAGFARCGVSASRRIRATSRSMSAGFLA